MIDPFVGCEGHLYAVRRSKGNNHRAKKFEKALEAFSGEVRCTFNKPHALRVLLALSGTCKRNNTFMRIKNDGVHTNFASMLLKGEPERPIDEEGESDQPFRDLRRTALGTVSAKGRALGSGKPRLDKVDEVGNSMGGVETLFEAIAPADVFASNAFQNFDYSLKLTFAFQGSNLLENVEAKTLERSTLNQNQKFRKDKKDLGNLQVDV